MGAHKGRPDIEIKFAYVDGECTEYDGQDTSPPPTVNIVWATLGVALGFLSMSNVTSVVPPDQHFSFSPRGS